MIPQIINYYCFEIQEGQDVQQDKINLPSSKPWWRWILTFKHDQKYHPLQSSKTAKKSSVSSNSEYTVPLKTCINESEIQLLELGLLPPGPF